MSPISYVESTYNLQRLQTACPSIRKRAVMEIGSKLQGVAYVARCSGGMIVFQIWGLDQKILDDARL